MDNRHTRIKKNTSFWVLFKGRKRFFKKCNAKSKATFQASLKSILFIGQLFSLIPVAGAFSNNVDDIRFEFSWKCIYTTVSLFGQSFMAVMTIYNLIATKTTLDGTSQVLYYVSATIAMVMYFKIARCWPDLVRQTVHVEKLDPSYDKSLALKCNVTCAIVLFLALVEHILSVFLALANSSICFSKYTLYEGFNRYFYPWIFDNISYSPVLALITQLLHIQATFIWNFSGLFVICMSYYLTSRLNHVNKKLLAAQGKYLPEIFWRLRREDFGRATHLVRKFDEVISGIIFITFANNLYFICSQLFNTLDAGIKGSVECSSRGIRTKILGGYEAVAFYSFSLVYLILRSVAVSVIASEVNSASMVPATVLYDVPSPVYCIEVQRFLEQVSGDKVALTGLHFFSITRGLLLSVAGTIVTYELVIFQFITPSSSDNSTVILNH